MTAYARLSSPVAFAVLLGIFGVAAAAVGVTASPLKSGFADSQEERHSDIWLYAAEVERIRGGENYYAAARAELTERGYPTKSLFNWRMPMPMWFLGTLPDPRLGQAMLAIASLFVLLWGFAMVADESGAAQGVWTALLLTGALMPTLLEDLYFLPVLWSGVFIAVSLCASARGRLGVAVVAGTLALFLREFAGAYVLTAFLWAVAGQRWREARGWLLGLAAFAAYFILHWWNVSTYRPVNPLAQAESWLQCGGAGFVISTAQMNAYLLLLPQWVTALYLVAALVGFGGWHSPHGQRFGVTTCLFLMAFAVIGQPFNQYWGSIYAPLLCFGVARCPASLMDLARAAWGRMQPRAAIAG